LVRWSPLLTLSPKSPGFKPQTGQKRRTKNLISTRQSEIRIKLFTDSIRKQQPKLRIGNLCVILSDRNFGFYKNIRNSTRSFGWAETGEILEVSGVKKSLCIVSRTLETKISSSQLSSSGDFVIGRLCQDRRSKKTDIKLKGSCCKGCQIDSRIQNDFWDAKKCIGCFTSFCI
jgi:hypothetical protein